MPDDALDNDALDTLFNGALIIDNWNSYYPVEDSGSMFSLSAILYYIKAKNRAIKEIRLKKCLLSTYV